MKDAMSSPISDVTSKLTIQEVTDEQILASLVSNNFVIDIVFEQSRVGTAKVDVVKLLYPFVKESLNTAIDANCVYPNFPTEEDYPQYLDDATQMNGLMRGLLKHCGSDVVNSIIKTLVTDRLGSIQQLASSLPSNNESIAHINPNVVNCFLDPINELLCDYIHLVKENNTDPLMNAVSIKSTPEPITEYINDTISKLAAEHSEEKSDYALAMEKLIDFAARNNLSLMDYNIEEVAKLSELYAAMMELGNS